MPIIENYSEHNFEFPYEKWDEKGERRLGGMKKLVFAKLTHDKDENNEAVERPGVLEVSDEELKMLRDHPVARSWFDRRGLVVREGAAPPAPKKRA